MAQRRARDVLLDPSDFRIDNLSRAGSIEEKSEHLIVVPSGQPVSAIR
jgi:hypothetical protein